MPRIVTCHLCKIIVRFPDVPPDTPLVPAKLVFKTGEEVTYRDDDGYPVMVPKYDPLLERFVEEHEHSMELDDQTFLRSGVIEVVNVEPKTWAAMDMVALVKGQIHERTGQWYEDRDTYREGAIACYNEHGNPDLASGCPDYLSDSKRIGTTSFKDDDGRTHVIPPKHQQFLCYQCPYMHAYVQVEKRAKRGMYREIA